jgi:hypothetical protein
LVSRETYRLPAAMKLLSIDFTVRELFGRYDGPTACSCQEVRDSCAASGCQQTTLAATLFKPGKHRHWMGRR